MLLSFQANSAPVCATSVCAHGHVYSVKVCASLNRTQLRARMLGVCQCSNPLPWYVTREANEPVRTRSTLAQASLCAPDRPPGRKARRRSTMAAPEPPHKKAAPKAYTPAFEPMNTLGTRMPADFAVTLRTPGGCMHVPCNLDTRLSSGMGRNSEIMHQCKPKEPYASWGWSTLQICRSTSQNQPTHCKWWWWNWGNM